jgi:hypothetical protein
MGSGAMTYKTSFVKICSGIRFRGNVFTKPLPSNDRGDRNTDTQANGRDL